MTQTSQTLQNSGFGRETQKIRNSFRATQVAPPGPGLDAWRGEG